MQHETQFHNLTLSPAQTDSAGAERHIGHGGGWVSPTFWLIVHI